MMWTERQPDKQTDRHVHRQTRRQADSIVSKCACTLCLSSLRNNKVH